MKHISKRIHIFCILFFSVHGIRDPFQFGVDEEKNNKIEKDFDLKKEEAREVITSSTWQVIDTEKEEITVKNSDGQIRKISVSKKGK